MMIAYLPRCGEDQFTCNNGMCIDIEKRCNLKTECQDKSDESSCATLDIPGEKVLTVLTCQGYVLSW